MKSYRTHIIHRWSLPKVRPIKLEAMENDDYVKLVEETRTKVLCYADATDWRVVKKSNGVVITTHQETGIPAKIFKAECEINLPPAQLFEYVAISNPSTSSGSNHSKVQKSVKSWDIVKEIDETTFILHSVSYSAGGGIISPREYLDLVSNFKDWEGCKFLSCATGVDITYPENPKYVRGRNYPSGILCLPVTGDPTKTRLVYIIHSYLGGRIPGRVADLALPSLQLSFISSLNKALKDDSALESSVVAAAGISQSSSHSP